MEEVERKETRGMAMRYIGRNSVGGEFDDRNPKNFRALDLPYE